MYALLISIHLYFIYLFIEMFGSCHGKQFFNVNNNNLKPFCQVARRRLKRPPRRSAHLSKNRVHVSLAEAGIDRVAPKVDQDVAVMRDEIRRDEDRRDHSGTGNGDDHGDIEEEEDEEDGDSPTAGDQKVAG